LKLFGPCPTYLQYLTVSTGLRQRLATSAVVRYSVLMLVLMARPFLLVG
jgi:hypothetical protein